MPAPALPSPRKGSFADGAKKDQPVETPPEPSADAGASGDKDLSKEIKIPAPGTPPKKPPRLSIPSEESTKSQSDEYNRLSFQPSDKVTARQSKGEKEEYDTLLHEQNG